MIRLACLLLPVLLAAQIPKPGGLRNINATGVAVGTYGSASAIPQITVAADGRITVLTTLASGGGADAVQGASALTTAGVIPVISETPGTLGQSFASITGSPVTMTLYDSTPGTGASTLVVRAGASQGTSAPLGSELVTNGDFASNLSGWTAGANWAWSAGTALHSVGATATLEQNVAISDGTTYQIEFTISGHTAGGLTVTVGAVTLIAHPWDPSFSSNGIWKRTLVGSGSGVQALAFTPTGTFDGALDNVTVRAITGVIPSIITWQNSAGVPVLEARGASDLANTSFGVGALRSNTSGYYNSAQGMNALYSNTIGSSNSAQGFGAGYTEVPANANVSGSQNVWLGVEAGPGVATQLDNTIGVGYRSHPIVSNQAVLGNSSITDTVLYGVVGLGSTTPDLAFSRTSPGTLQVNSGTAGKWGILDTGGISMKSLATPGAVAVAPTCVPGVCNLTWSYTVQARLADGTLTTVPGAVGSTAAQNATLDGTNYNTLSCAPVSGATSYRFRRTVSGGTPATLGVIGTASTCALVDNGLVGDGSAAPDQNTTGSLGPILSAVWSAGAEGTCNASNRGRVVMVQGGAGVADTFRICTKDAADAYAFRALY